MSQPVGESLPGWVPPPPVEPVTLTGRTVSLVPLSVEHADDLWQELCVDAPDSLWTYLFSGPYDDRAAFDAYVRSVVDNLAQAALAVVVDGRVLGHQCYLRIDPTMGSVEVGNIALSPRLQRTTAATEASYLLMRHVFDLGYRRYEWKCDALNAPSRAAAARFGFTFEGIFRQAVVYKGRNRDTAWFAVTDREWPAVRAAYEAWLAPANFDADGRQRTRLVVPTGSPPDRTSLDG